MKEFFEKYPVELKESTALKMIHKKIESAEEKCKKKDQQYLEDAAMAHAMLTDFFEELNINPAGLV